MERWSGKVAIVTGASAGIGVAIARALVEDGLKVVAIARRHEILDELAGQLKGQKGKLYPMRCDLRKEEDILKVFEWTEKELGGVDVLVNNAGVLVPGSITEGTTESYHKILDVNVIAPAICSRETVRSLKKRKTPGHIININSVAGHFATMIQLPINLYPASKYALTAMCMGLVNELAQAKLDIKVTSISPGAVDTQMITSVGIPEASLKNLPMLQPKQIADAVIYALSTPRGTEVREIIIMPQEGFFGDSKAWTMRSQQTLPTNENQNALLSNQILPV